LQNPILKQVHAADTHYGSTDIGQGQKFQVEFVSSNPTGPLHVGHGRGAAVGDAVANLLSVCGYDVQKEYYINDSGRQIHTLGRSVYLRYKELSGQKVKFPADCYQGGYIRDLAAEIKSQKGDTLLGQPEEDARMICARFAAAKILEGIRDDLKLFGVEFDCWFSEQSLYDSGRVDQILADFRKKGIVYEKEGALWFKTSDFGDEKDRVVVKHNGETTYFASDIAYHQDKYDRGFERVIDVWGADHHGYIPRMKAAVEASGHQRDQFDVILVQLVNLLRAGEPVAMSTRAGEFVRKAREQEACETSWDDKAVARLDKPEEIDLIKALARYPDVLAGSAESMEPHRVTFYLMDLASAFHTYYNKHRVLSDDPLLQCGRLNLVLAVQKVIRNGLTLLGVSAPDRM
jgi:arginyl-tRNA synthetase